MAKRKIDPDQGEFETICEMIYQLTDILAIIGVVELCISKKNKNITWDTEGGGMINPEELKRLSYKIESYYMELIAK